MNSSILFFTIYFSMLTPLPTGSGIVEERIFLYNLFFSGLFKYFIGNDSSTINRIASVEYRFFEKGRNN